MYAEEHTITYAQFCVRTNKIYIIVSTEVPDYPKKFPGTSCVPIVCQVFSIVFPGEKNFWGSPPGHAPRDFPREDEIRSNNNYPGG